MPRLDRDAVVALAATAIVSAVGFGTLHGASDGAAAAGGGPDVEPAQNGRLTARPRRRALRSLRPGVHRLTPNLDRGALLYIPRRYRASRPARLVLTLHGAGGGARNGLGPFLRLADAFGLILLAPESRGPTWDVARGGFGPDVAFINRVLATAFARCSVDRRRVTVAGFSDGASYALSLGLTNGDLFSRILAFSPGFTAHRKRRGRPAIFVSHGTDDPVLPIERCSRRIVPLLRDDGHAVRYREFRGGHTVPGAIARDAVSWLL